MPSLQKKNWSPPETQRWKITCPPPVASEYSASMSPLDRLGHFELYLVVGIQAVQQGHLRRRQMSRDVPAIDFREAQCPGVHQVQGVRPGQPPAPGMR